MSILPAFRSGSESFVAFKYSKCLPVWFLFFMIKIQTGLDTWRKLHLEYTSKAVTFCDRGRIVIFLGEFILPVLAIVFLLRFRPQERKPACPEVLTFVDSQGSDYGLCPFGLGHWWSLAIKYP